MDVDFTSDGRITAFCLGAHAGVPSQHVLHLARRDVLATAHDHVLDAVHDVEIPLLVDAAGVAGVQPAVDDRGRRRLGVAPVALRDLRCSYADLSDATRRKGHAVAVDDAHGDAGRGSSGRAQEPFVAGRGAPVRVR